MGNKTISECDKDYFLFLEAGFVAVNNTDEDSALKLFMATQTLRPDNHFYKIGFGYMHMCKLELKQAEEMFESVLKADPKNEMAMSFLAICRSMMPGKVSEGEKMLEGIGKESADSDIKELVNRSRDFIDKFVKKGSKSPMDIAKPKKKEE
ncbi:MAG: hypothetical protein SP4CHLAM5_09710 [Chlamydiia bacterium]|nr:hypothetical protein [Chlamydiia bacterium]MCH9618829.1 hypothetical protein [Chlamydiia bacterium]MCH9624369.1 hypothetical protein [Chlamydiia bacterium]